MHHGNTYTLLRWTRRLGVRNLPAWLWVPISNACTINCTVLLGYSTNACV